MTTHDTLLHAITEYDRRESRKRCYNHYALAQYLARLADVESDIQLGRDARTAILAGFCGRLADTLLRAIKADVSTNAERRSGAYVYERAE